MTNDELQVELHKVQERNRILLAACQRAWTEMHGDYVDEVWGRELEYLENAIEGAVPPTTADELAKECEDRANTSESLEKTIGGRNTNIVFFRRLAELLRRGHSRDCTEQRIVDALRRGLRQA